MIKAEHSWLHQLFFRNYFRYILWKDFHRMEITGEYYDRGLPLLIIGNHISWWDGFFPYELNRRILKRRFHILMLEEQLQRIKFFRRLGAFSIDPGKRSALQSVSFASEILKKKDNMLVLFPQGEIRSQYQEEIIFRKGWFRILKNTSNPVHVLFMANLTDYLSHRRPTLSMYLESYSKTDNFIFADLCKSYNDFYQRCLENQKWLQ